MNIRFGGSVRWFSRTFLKRFGSVWFEQYPVRSVTSFNLCYLFKQKNVQRFLCFLQIYINSIFELMKFELTNDFFFKCKVKILHLSISLSNHITFIYFCLIIYKANSYSTQSLYSPLLLFIIPPAPASAQMPSFQPRPSGFHPNGRLLLHQGSLGS